MKAHASADSYFASAKEWKQELAELRTILRATELEETVKWGGPVYTLDGKNVVGLGGFKSYFGLWFYQGALLRDERGLLVNAQAGKTKALRQMRLNSKAEIGRKTIRAYVEEAIDLSRRGAEIKPERDKPLTVPAGLRAALRENAEAKAGFEALTPGKRRECAEYVASAKRADTKQRRLEKILPMLESGVGLNDKYRKC